ncbi:sigma-54 dependent transcriptional regulator [Desulfogranum marinum]|uniref:sigma-54-dependent transcriptional regulator n=1 Tax=Desulfogranum marinum TaxID=453220 RepID=UPI0029C63417|nr:sigma-54 dependent transcriptional regulator [Desulfogranum marinum]
MKSRVLIIEDEERMRHLLTLVLSEEGYEVQAAEDGVKGMLLWRDMEPHAVLTDLKMARADGMEVLDFRNRRYQNVPLIILTAFGTIQSAVTAMKQGAYDYLTKPIDNMEVVRVVARAIADTRKEVGVSRGVQGEAKMVGSSQVMHKLYEDIKLIGSTKMSVLITGESGTGKELIAQSIHAHSPRAAKPFIRVNCAAIPHDLLESELFGHVRGAFTGAVGNREGAFVEADKGTIFLDEIGDLPLDLQPKILHAVEDKLVSPVGSSKSRLVDVKIIAATNRNLDQMVHNRQFRSDLYHRLNMYPLRVPPLRQRGVDLDELVDYFVALFCREQNKPPLVLADGVLQLLQSYHWPGNVRELKNVLERVVLVCRHGEITEDLLPEKIRSEYIVPQSRSNDYLDLSSQERNLILAALEQSGWNQSKAARKLGITRNTLRYRMKKYAINRTM